MAERIKKRLRSRAGESIAEVLVALLISVMGLALLAGMVTAAKNMITRSKTATEAYVIAENILSEQPASVPADGPVTQNASASVSTGRKLVDDVETPIGVITYSVTSGNKTIVSYKVNDNAS